MRPPRPTFRLLPLAAAAALALAGCSGDARPTVRVFAAASLTAPFAQLVDAFAARHPELRVELHDASAAVTASATASTPFANTSGTSRVRGLVESAPVSTCSANLPVRR